MKEITRLKWLFGVLYFVQGGAISYFSLFQKPYLDKIGVPRDQIALISTLLLLPFVLKIGFGYLSDHVAHPRLGRRKPYMIGGLSLACLAFFLCGFFTPENYLLLYSAFVLCASFCVALFDAATDGLAMDRVPEEQQGPVQSFMVGGKALGVILLSVTIGYLVQWKGYSFVFFAMGTVFLIPLALSFMVRSEKPEDQEDVDKVKKRSLKDTPFWSLAFFGITYSVISFGSDGLVTLYMSDAYHLPEKAVGFYGSFRGLGAILGASLAGLLLARLKPGLVNMAALFFIAFGVLILGHGLSDQNYRLIAGIWGVFWAFQEVCYLALVMRMLRGTFSAFGFASLMAMANLGTALGEGLATSLTQWFTFSQVFSLMAGFIFVPIFILWRIQKHELWVESPIEDLSPS